MEPRTPLFVEKLSRYLRYVEIGSLVLIVIAMGLFYVDSTLGLELIMIGLSALSATYFLYAFTLPPPKPGTEAAPSLKGFIGQLATILRKVIYIGCSVSLVGLLFDHLKLVGAGEMFMIGGTTLVISCLSAGILVLRDNTSLGLLQGPLLRGVPILIIACYWMVVHLGL